MNPLVSIIIPTYNRAHLIGETLDSVLAQTYKNWECIVVDDVSTDYTHELLEFYCERDERIQYHHRLKCRPNGANACRNYGLENSKGELVQWLDSDDLIIKNCLQNRIALYHCFPEMNMFIFNSGVFTHKIGDNQIVWNKIIENEPMKNLISRFLDSDMPWHTNGVLWDRNFIFEIGKWNENLMAWQDWELHLRALFHNPKFCIGNTIPDNYYRMGVANSIASSKMKKKYKSSVALAIKEIEKFLSGDPNNREFKKKLKFLIYRSLIYYPMRLGNLKGPLYLIIKGCKFQNVSKFKFLAVYFFEILNKSFVFKNFFKNKVKLSYYHLLKPSNTFLKLKTEYKATPNEH